MRNTYKRIDHNAKFKTLLLGSTLLLCSTMAMSQEQIPVKTQAMDFYNRQEYALAARKFEAMPEKARTKDSAVMRKLANCYYQIDEYTKAADAYRSLVSLSYAKAEDFLNYGDMLKATGNYTDAINAYKLYEQKSGKQVTNRIAGCSIDWSAKIDKDVRIENYSTVNSAGSDWGAVYHPETGLLYVSDSIRYNDIYTKGNNSKEYGRTDRPFLKIQAEKNTSAGNALEEALNFSNLHVGPVAFSPNNDTAYFTVTNSDKIEYSKENKIGKVGNRRLMLYMSVYKNHKWQKAVPFKYNQPDLYSVGHAAISSDGNILYFASNMPGGYGGTDIWYCEKDETGNWGTPKNCGDVINTFADEAFPSIGVDGTLYFSSKGHIGMGGYDIFSTRGQGSTWTLPENMQQPVNSTGDDFSFAAQDEKIAYISSNRLGGKGDDDIYKLYGNWTAFDIVSLVALDKRTNTRMKNATVEVESSGKKYTGLTDDKGVYTIKVQKNEPVHVTVTKDGYTALNLEIKPQSLKDTVYAYAEKDKQLLPPPVRQMDSIRDVSVDRYKVNYDFDKATIRSVDMPDLNRLIQAMKNDPSLMVIVASFTDCKGNQAYNLKLSERRSAAVRAYLQERGIKSNRINTTFFGKAKLLLACEDAAYDVNEQEINRRSELLLTKETK